MDHIEAGQQFDVERVERGEYRLTLRQSAPNEGLIDWLITCPEKGFFVPVESERFGEAGAGERAPLDRGDPHELSREAPIFGEARVRVPVEEAEVEG